MEHIKDNSYFSKLPNEILIKILAQLPTFDLYRFCEAYAEYKYFLQDKDVICKIDLSRQYLVNERFPFYQFFKSLGYEFIKVLNLTNMYWLHTDLLKKCLKLLCNVEELYLIGTGIGMTKKDNEIFSDLTKVRTMSLTLEAKEFLPIGKTVLPELKKLCVQIASKDRNFNENLLYLLNKHDSLERLWIYDTTNSYPLNYDVIHSTLRNLKHYVVKAVCAIFSNYIRGYDTIFLNKRWGLEFYLRKSRGSSMHISTICPDSLWAQLAQFQIGTCGGLKDEMSADVYGESYDNHYFEELNFIHRFCCSRYTSIVKDILSCKNISHLKRLAITNCLFKSDELTDAELCNNVLKRRRIAKNASLVENHKIFIKNFANVEYLEVYNCDKDTSQDIFLMIPHLISLRNLYLQVPPFVNGNFLYPLFDSCSLEVLKVETTSTNEPFNSTLSTALPFAQQLKDFKYKCYRAKPNSLFEVFSKTENSKLERFVLDCKEVDHFDMRTLETFLQHNSKLVLVHITVANASKICINRIKKILRQYKKGKEQIFIAQKSSTDVGYPPIPQYHFEEMISSTSKVSSIDVCNDFLK